MDDYYLLEVPSIDDLYEHLTKDFPGPSSLAPGDSFAVDEDGGANCPPPFLDDVGGDPGSSFAADDEKYQNCDDKEKHPVFKIKGCSSGVWDWTNDIHNVKLVDCDPEAGPCDTFMITGERLRIDFTVVLPARKYPRDIADFVDLRYKLAHAEHTRRGHTSEVEAVYSTCLYILRKRICDRKAYLRDLTIVSDSPQKCASRRQLRMQRQQQVQQYVQQAQQQQQQASPAERELRDQKVIAGLRKDVMKARLEAMRDETKVTALFKYAFKLEKILGITDGTAMVLAGKLEASKAPEKKK